MSDCKSSTESYSSIVSPKGHIGRNAGCKWYDRAFCVSCVGARTVHGDGMGQDVPKRLVAGETDHQKMVYL